MNRQGYEELGERHARNGHAMRYPGPDGSWQAAAYWSGVNKFESENRVFIGRRHPGKSVINGMLRAKAQGPELLERIQAGMWPSGAKAHASYLINQLQVELSYRRQGRLQRALLRLQARHGKVAPQA